MAYVSRIMSKNFRKEGQPEKERIAQLTGLELDKVCEMRVQWLNYYWVKPLYWYCGEVLVVILEG